jgi:hypothetical protein
MVLREEDPDTSGGYNFRLKFQQKVPTAWGGILGDIIHNLRSAYDLLACDLVRVHDENGVTQGTGFPISKCRNEKYVMQKLAGASQRAIDLVHDLKPYKEGNENLWCIHRLDILDKHRLIMPVTFLMGGHGAYVTKSQIADIPFALDPPQMLFMPTNKIRIRQAEDGMVIDWILNICPEPSSVHGDVTVNVAFAVDEFLSGEPVIPSLHRLLDFTKQTVSLFAAEIFGIT